MNGEQQQAIPVTLVGGYLGAGKTTLVNHLLRHSNGKRLAILVNEFGDLPIDADLIEAESDDLISLAGGCVCCSYGDGLMEAFLKLKGMTPPPDRVVLEASGVAIPSPIAGAISLLDGFELDGLVCLVDGEQIERQARDKYLSDTIDRQLAGTDIVVVNKADLIEDDALDRIRILLAEKAERAAIVVAEHAKVAPDLLLQNFDRAKTSVTAANEIHSASHETCLVEPDGPTDLERFTGDLFERFPKIVRAKGFVQDGSGRLMTISVVGQRVSISPAPKDAEPGIVVISLK